ncbi:rhodanese-like domain-containing protein [Altererythrobacter salegens]|uniref:Rhodanese-like domain-containing protein n=1 Tax=Croceibacterium salegens TaxID=1737568 RepID=A0A6I4SWD5_9SPHN|nr:rhodanese-like domain-containing protein [Croceibacterium salegens]MXO58652.1 rhodanese-like domain-containing protein [Croceibacterium salegens]
MTARFFLPLAALALLAGCHAQGKEEADESIGEIPMQHLAGMMGPRDVQQVMMSRPQLAVLDVRTPEEFAAGHIAGATNIDFKNEDFAAQIAALPKDKDYIVYCRTGHRSGQALEAMQGMGFQHVANMEGGITAWQDGGLPVEN